MSKTGEINIEAILLLKNPLFLLHLETLPSPQVPFEQLHCRYEPLSLSDSFSSMWQRTGRKMGGAGVEVDVDALCFSGQNLLIWPALLQLKHSPFFIMSFCLSVFKASTSIVSGSLRWMFHFCLGSSFVFSEVFPVDRPNIHCILLKLLSSLLAILSNL